MNTLTTEKKALKYVNNLLESCSAYEFYRNNIAQWINLYDRIIKPFDSISKYKFEIDIKVY